MKEWDALVKECILGSKQGRATQSENFPELNARFASWAHLPAEQQRLNGLALFQTYLLAGKSPWLDVDTPLEAAAPESKAFCSDRSSQLIKRFLGEKDDHLLAELVRLIASHNQVVPAQFLPALVKAAQRNSRLPAPLHQAMGSRGLWLCSLNPEWTKLFGLQQKETGAPGKDDDWEYAHGPWRLELFTQALTGSPEQTLTKLCRLWPQESASERQALLKCFAPLLSVHHINFLQGCLKDRSQVVRKIACGYLLKLGDRALWAWFQTFINTAFAIKKKLLGKSQLVVSLPQSFDPEWKTLGIQEKTALIPTLGKVGEKSGWVYQLLSCINPENVAGELGIDLQQLVDLADRSDHADVLLAAMDAAAKQDSCESYVVVRSRHLNGEDQLAWLGQMADAFPLEAIEPILDQNLDGLQKKIGKTWIKILYLLDRFSQLPPQLSEKTVNALIFQSRGQSREYGIGPLIDNLGYRLSLQVGSSIVPRLQAEQNDLFAVLLHRYQQRLEVHKEFNP